MPENADATSVYTVGHSTHPIDEFLDLLGAHGVEGIVDVRTVPKSRHNPQYFSEPLSESLRDSGLTYRRIESLGGLRRTSADSINGGWRNASFRGYADYMQTPEFRDGIEELLRLGRQRRVAIMCAEAVPWRCHRSLIGDALLVRGVDVRDIMSRTSARPHALTSFARVDGDRISYPPEEVPPDTR